METPFSIPRTSANVQYNIDILNKLSIDFIVQHGTYTTSIISEEAKARYMMNVYNNRVFRCANMIKKDVLESENAKAIIESKFLKTNFGVSQNIKSYRAKEVKSIDISSAYATCLFNNGLISKKTFNTIKKLPKKERLPCVGMLATSYTKFHYKDGLCVSLDPFRSPTSPVFYFLIDEINYIMQNIQFFLGEKFIFYWVDGIFFHSDTDEKTIITIEDFLTDAGYIFKYDKVENFRLSNDEKKIMIKMVKNDKPKQYLVGLDDVGKSVKDYLMSEIKQQKQTPIILK